ncbi:MAG TPA: hypothetical protein VE398_15055 [Acidobacteriota bacterium]|nr:hypothetical protein [Acidobacteriota bacterium]
MLARLVIALALYFIGGQEPQAPTKAPESSSSPYIERDQRQFTFYPGGKLDIVAGIPGSVRIIGWGRSAVMLQIERIIYYTAPDQARLLASQYPLQLRWTQTTGTIRTVGPPNSTVIMETNLTIYVPREKTDIKAQLVKGDLAVGSLNGWIEANLKEGNIEASALSGYFSALTKLGNLHVEMAGKGWLGHEFSAVTQKGTADVVLPVDYSAALFLETRNGTMQIQYPAQTVEGESVPLYATTKKNAHSLTAKVGGGGAPVKVLTMFGNVTLAAK